MSGEAGTPVICSTCGEVRLMLHPRKAGKMCRRCAAAIGSSIAALGKRDPLDRFMEKVKHAPNGCWEWTSTRQVNGYSTFYCDGRSVRGHRWAYEHFVGPIPDELQIDHLCRNRACVNPDHLEAVTALENSRRAMRSNCVNGHAFTPENTYVPSDGKRYCRECRRRRVREQRERKRHAA